MDKRLRKVLRSVYRDRKIIGSGIVVHDSEDRLKRGLRASDRVRYDDDGESWMVYGYIMPSDILHHFANRKDHDWGDYLSLTDDEVQEFVDECMTVRIFSDYDCTGKAFTRWIDWHRNPCGLISFVHAMSVDL